MVSSRRPCWHRHAYRTRALCGATCHHAGAPLLYGVSCFAHEPTIWPSSKDRALRGVQHPNSLPSKQFTIRPTKRPLDMMHLRGNAAHTHTDTHTHTPMRQGRLALKNKHVLSITISLSMFLLFFFRFYVLFILFLCCYITLSLFVVVAVSLSLYLYIYIYIYMCNMFVIFLQCL